MTDPDDPWVVTDGGSLELYPLQEETSVHKNDCGLKSGIPTAKPLKCILPKHNTMVLFTVQPGRSYHAVQEVFSDVKPRLSISGWYHGTEAPLGSDKASLQQIMAKESSTHTMFRPIVLLVDNDKLTSAEIKELKAFINPTYLTDDAMNSINKQFCDNSHLQLNDFIRKDLALQITKDIILADRHENIGKGKAQLDYDIGSNANWSIIGPSHMRRHLVYKDDNQENKTIDSNIAVGRALEKIRKGLFNSSTFCKYLKKLTTLHPTGIKDEIRRFRAGLDYTIAHYGSISKESRLDVTLCFCNNNKDLELMVDTMTGKKRNGQEQEESERKKKTKFSSGISTTLDKKGSRQDEDEDADADEDEDEDEDYEALWDSGDVGAFECYIEADEDPDNPEAAEVV